jgi:hypothetical protein
MQAMATGNFLKRSIFLCKVKFSKASSFAPVGPNSAYDISQSSHKNINDEDVDCKCIVKRLENTQLLTHPHSHPWQRSHVGRSVLSDRLDWPRQLYRVTSPPMGTIFLAFYRSTWVSRLFFDDPPASTSAAFWDTTDCHLVAIWS